MRKVILGGVLCAALSLCAARADARGPVVFFGTGQVGVQNQGDTGAQYGVEAGARILVFEGYLGYMRFGAGQSVSRAILGLRGAIGSERLRLVLRLGGGAIREQGGTLSPPGDVPLTRTGGVARAGFAVEVRPVGPPIWVGLGADGESYGFFANSLGVPTHDSDVVGTVRLTFELGR